MRNKIKICLPLLFITITISINVGLKPHHIDFVSMPNTAEASVDKTDRIYTVTFEQLKQTKNILIKGREEKV